MAKIDVPTLPANETATSPSLEDLQRIALEAQIKREELQLRALLREEAKIADAAETLQRVRTSMQKGAEQEERKRQAEQRACPHLNEKNYTRLRGQMNSDGSYHIVCTNCQKEYDSRYNPAPPNLLPPQEFIGGPMHYNERPGYAPEASTVSAS